MLLTKLSVENFGLFRERQFFDLMNRDAATGEIRPIVLFGGKNGAGKTTLFEAFRICLYGNTLPEFRLRKLDYDEYVRKKIHRSRSAKYQSASASISLEFEYARLGKVDKYHVERSWNASTNGVEEQFQVKMNGNLIEELEKSQWQDFVNEMIPIGVSKLFFFDGEKIQILAEDESDEVHLRDSFYSLLGLDLVDRLKADLAIRLAKQARDADDLFGKKFDDTVAEKQKLEEEKGRILEDSAHQRTRLDVKKKAAARLEDKLSREGGYFARKRDELKERKSLLEARIDDINRQIARLCEGLLPFAFAPKYCALLKKRLIEEDARQSELMAAKELKKILDRVEKKTICNVKNLDLGKKSKRKAIAEIEHIFDEATATTTRRKRESVKLLHHLSSIEQKKVLGWIDSALGEIPKQVRALAVELERHTVQLEKTAGLLGKAPADEVIGPIFQELGDVNREIGKIEAAIKFNTEKVSQVDYKLTIMNARLRELEKEQRKHTSLERGLGLAQWVQDALGEYEIRLKKEKIEMLGDSLLRCLNELMHKEVFESVTIDPDTFSVTLLDKGGHIVSKEQLSAGEKQIYAIAMLWALARTSGRPLPFIIDTPLGRLDTDHRLNLVQHFFPVASHQVIIFSTDTEIDQNYFEELSDHIAQSYKLEYEDEEGRTTVKSGYFWREKIPHREVVQNELQ